MNSGVPAAVPPSGDPAAAALSSDGHSPDGYSPDGGPLEILQAGGGHGRGNALFLDREGGAILKVYRPRRGASQAWREGLRSFGHRFFEGKRGTSPKERAQTEAAALRAWAKHGFDAPRLIDRAIPAEITDPALWIEYCPGRTLDLVLSDPTTDPVVARSLVERLAVDHAGRHRAALENAEPLLLQEHASIVHTLESGERLVTFDFENAYGRGFSSEIAISHELAGTLRSFFRRLGDCAGRAHFDQYVAAYPDRDLIERAAHRATCGGGIGSRLKRWSDGRRANRPSKTEVMVWVAEAVRRGT